MGRPIAERGLAKNRGDTKYYTGRPCINGHNPDNFKFSDISEQTKKYCFDNFSYYDLAEMFYPAFMRNWRDRLEDGRKPKWKDPDLSLKRWVRESSPRGNIYSVKIWEAAIEKCKAKMNKEKPKIPLPKIKTTPKKADKRIAREEIEKMFARLKT